MDYQEKNVPFGLTYLYASKEGVYQRINQYLYQIIVLENEELIKLLKKIITKELKNFLFLGRILKSKKIYPIFANNKKYWNAYDLYYDMDEKTILEIDLEQKKKAIFNYQIFLSNTKEEPLKEQLQTILEEEYKELEELTKFYKKKY